MNRGRVGWATSRCTSSRASSFCSLRLSDSLMSRLLTTRLTLHLRFPFLDALLVPDRSHSKLAVRAGYTTEVPSGEVGEHGVSLESQAPTQSSGIEDLIILGHTY